MPRLGWALLVRGSIERGGRPLPWRWSEALALLERLERPPLNVDILCSRSPAHCVLLRSTPLEASGK